MLFELSIPDVCCLGSWINFQTHQDISTKYMGYFISTDWKPHSMDSWPCNIHVISLELWLASRFHKVFLTLVKYLLQSAWAGHNVYFRWAGFPTFILYFHNVVPVQTLYFTNSRPCQIYNIYLTPSISQSIMCCIRQCSDNRCTTKMTLCNWPTHLIVIPSCWTPPVYG